jgi:hypothetical protein
MEDSRGLISNGSFGLIKSERLLSTTKKILNEIKPPSFEGIKTEPHG